MSDISISKRHNKSRDDIEDLVDEMRRVLVQDYGCRCDRRGDTLSIARRGVNGSLQLREQAVDITIRLGPMMSMLARPLEDFIQRELDKHLGGD